MGASEASTSRTGEVGFPTFDSIDLGTAAPASDSVDTGAALWETPEHIAVPPVFTSPDLKGLDFLETYPGIPPFLRGPYATMYVNQPWTIRQ
ncbi:MAG TPA: methylmalonyl-CoA mutase family protein, partial [Propionibacteriaceae bacterium]